MDVTFPTPSQFLASQVHSGQVLSQLPCAADVGQASARVYMLTRRQRLIGDSLDEKIEDQEAIVLGDNQARQRKWPPIVSSLGAKVEDQ